MAHSLSAKKRIRQNEKRRLRNRVRRERLRKALRSFTEVLRSGDEQTIQAELQKVHKAVDKARTKGVLHRRTADRTKSRLALAVQRQTQPAT